MRTWYGVNEKPLFIPTCLGTEQMQESGKNTILHHFHVDIITFESFQIIFHIEYQHTTPVEHC